MRRRINHCCCLLALFIVGLGCGEMTAEEKDALSHRGKALEKLAEFFHSFSRWDGILPQPDQECNRTRSVTGRQDRSRIKTNCRTEYNPVNPVIVSNRMTAARSSTCRSYSWEQIAFNYNSCPVENLIDVVYISNRPSIKPIIKVCWQASCSTRMPFY